ncbi:fluoride efflux transporter CrcB [Roseibacillus persicicus]|uniref:Fluoride-specific ion channel FluC n=1 Tax=Roseibacillus persicicus TaxID=454148 RepID=A0A918WGS8_9BACT|nr:fluoride efflux transporter CrcB [Roseibacillus persicicus]GHC50039.1 putative fluoride ion transporter CrcB [Roseibacillus persicicus]
MKLFLVFLGGGLGAVARFTLTKAISDWAGIRFPWGILTCNLLGCFLIGLAAGHASKSAPDWFGPLLIVGFLGGFTTFSTFSNDSLSLIRSGEASLGLINILASVIPGVLAVWLGLRLTGS